MQRHKIYSYGRNSLDSHKEKMAKREEEKKVNRQVQIAAVSVYTIFNIAMLIQLG